jgi:hypothetical protein
MRDGFVRIRSKSGSKRSCNSFLERVASDFLQLGPDRVETLPFALADLDRQKLQEVPVAVGRTGARSLGAIE